MITLQLTLEGTCPMLQHRFNEASEQAVATVSRKKSQQATVTPRDEALSYLYVDTDGFCTIPGMALIGALARAAKNFKAKGSRASYESAVKASVICTEDAIGILVPGEAPGIWERATPARCEVDSRSVVIPATRGRIMRHRPRWDRWRVGTEVRLNTDLVPFEVFHQSLTLAGEACGLGDFRPTFGRFRVVELEEVVGM